jgi:pimeloyl-ACP methyl ester carboxylesterase
MSGPPGPALGDVLRYTIAPIISWAMLPSILRKLFAPRSISERFKKDFPTSLTLRPKQLRAAAEESAFLIPAVAQLQRDYPKLRCPVRIVHGANDELIEPEQSERLHQVLGHSVLQLVNNAGHMVTYTSDARIADTVAAIRNEGEQRGELWQEEVHHIGSPRS